jgi:molybdenum cofactor cytidylyltransferase
MGSAENNVATIVLAAGYSSRTGSAFKPLLKLGGFTVLERALMSHLDAGIRDVRVVVGYRGDEVMEAVGHLGVRAVINPNFDKGMFSSVQAGVATLETDVRAFFIMPVDIPLVDPSTILTVLENYTRNCRGITYPLYKGRRGHPPLIARKYISEIMESPAPDGLRGILNSHEAEACDVEVDDEAVLLDIDTLEDYQRLLQYRGVNGVPNHEQCMSLLEEANLEESIRDHCRMVAAVACRLAYLLNEAGAGLNEKLVHAAALLHDIKRNEKDHARGGAMFLRARGYARVADVVAEHMDMESAEGVFPTETEIVYLADKLVMEKSYVSLRERFAAALERYKGDEKVRMSILRRREQAEKIKKKVERAMGSPMEEMLSMNLPGRNRERLPES